MCGIAGELRFDGAPVSPDNLVRMRDTMVHRGPDGEGVYISPKRELGLAHRRLSIIDLSDAAAQPMSSVDGSVWIAFNGEIYNHRDLRNELQSAGHHEWKTNHSDTEVIIQAYQRWGMDCLRKLRGMFAFAIWDENKKQLFIARDRLGIKPLYYYLDGHRFLFASEIKAILAAPEIRRQVNEESLFHFMTFATTPAPNTLFAGIHKLPAAHCAVVTTTGLKPPVSYWDVWGHVEDLRGKSEDQIGERLVHELETAIRMHKVADVPVGVFLSGGMDSSVNTVLFSKGETQPVDTFTIDYDSELEAHKSEVGYAERVADLVGAKKHVKRISQKELIQFLPEMIYLQDEPFADPVCVPIYYISKLAREAGIKVCQVGEGADELFCGYPSWMLHCKIDFWRQRLGSAAVKKLILFGMRALQKEGTFTYQATKRAFNNELQFLAGAEAFTHQHKMEILSPRLKAKFSDFSSLEVVKPIRKRFMENAPDQSIVQWMAYVDMNIRLPETLLMRIDKMGMGVGIESRVPYLDHKFVEFAMSVPSNLKIKGGQPKHIFRHAIRDLLPSDILNRKKQGFSVPIEQWFFSDLGGLMHSELKSFCEETDFFSWKEVEKLLTEKRALQCWFLLNVAMWWKNWIRP